MPSSLFYTCAAVAISELLVWYPAGMDKEQKAEDGLRYALEQLQKKGVKNTIELATATSNLGHFLR